jgi:peptide/nickel transport system permease protein
MLSPDTRSDEEGPVPVASSNPSSAVRLREILSSIKADKGAMVGFVIVAIFVIVALAEFVAQSTGFLLAPYNPIKTNVGPQYAAPSLAHLMGTDNLGRDVFSRIITATPNDLGVSFTVIIFALCIGAIVGSYAAFHGGILDEALMRVTDIFFAIPALVLAMSIALALGPGITNMTVALMIIWWPPYARLARGEALKIAHQNYIEAARLSGAGRSKIILRHVLPNISLTLLVYASLDIGTVILVYAGLSYLGLGIKPPYPDWGQMVSAYQDFMLSYPWLPFFPGLIIALGVIGFSLLGDGLKNTLTS